MSSHTPYIQPSNPYEYLLLIEPREDLADDIMAIKKEFSEKYQAPQAVSSKPHITLVSFTQYMAFESRIRQRFRQIATERAPMLIELEGFGSFPTHTLFIKVTTRTTVQNLVTKLRTQVQSLLKPDKEHKPHFIMEPHITIARRLKPWQYEKSWSEYNTRPFSAKFMANHMVLLRKQADGERFTFVERFEFMNMPVCATQAMLF